MSKENLNRVSDNISDTVLEFVKDRGTYPFLMDDLTRFVNRKHCVAPDSPGRILRDLRRKGAVKYRVVSRRDSLYVFEGT